jgi:hypothetical protein
MDLTNQKPVWMSRGRGHLKRKGIYGISDRGRTDSGGVRIGKGGWIRSRSSLLSNTLTAIATYYILFAVMGSSTRAMIIESLVASAFLMVALTGFQRNLWVVVAALAGHGVFDFCHDVFIQNPGVPVWWRGFCLSFDLLAGGFLAMLLVRRSGFALGVSRS